MKFSMGSIALLALSSLHTTLGFSTGANVAILKRMQHDSFGAKKSLCMSLEGVELLKTQSNYLQDPLNDVSCTYLCV